MLWNQLEKNMGHEVETRFMHRLIGIVAVTTIVALGSVSDWTMDS